ncbi:flagellar export chaperone FliS [Heliobacterium gestii]|uniref:Flagellar secretion chaperone FliS n=1 Tax=Heliomicrobium gestii TaxID=2699 RepID=A0A845LCG1_HELGE|nr:flagellar export chaperone FliS [Heliomicrobium gestii]MBM7866676.1 flagellar protein FliS [Heliomicrobium gestii]MZP43044.1 flagellar export chaperone FliS [Heliomicrobium gestii]
MFTGTPHQQNAALNQYRNTAVQTAAPEKLLLMLYDGAIRFLHQAIKYIDEKKPNEAHQNIVKAQNIIVELTVTLNMDYPISQNLRSLYDFFFQHLVQANVKKDTKMIMDIIKLLSELRDTWEEAARIAKTQSSSGGGA